jgi:spermidine/putrescine-binding protein
MYLPNLGNLSPIFTRLAHDPENRYTVAWQWGLTGIAWRQDLLGAVAPSWGVFLDRRYRGRMTMLDDPRDVIGAFLRYRGHSINSDRFVELEEARRDAIAAKLNLRAYLSAPVKGQLISGDVPLAQLWSGDANQAMLEQPALQFVLPAEGSTLLVDFMAVPAAAPHPRAAHEFINYVLRRTVAAAIADATGYGTPNQGALEFLKTPKPLPTPDELARLEIQMDLGRASEMWDRVWTEIKTA